MDIVIRRTDTAITKKLFKIRLKIFFRMNYTFFFIMCGIGVSLIFSGNNSAYTGAGVTFIFFGLMKLITTLTSMSKSIASHDKLSKPLEIHLRNNDIEVISYYLSNKYNWMYFKKYLIKDGNIFIYESSIINAVSIAKEELSAAQFIELKTQLANYGVLAK